MRVGDDASVMEVIETCDVWKQTVKDKDITFLRDDWNEVFTILDIIAEITCCQGWIESFRVFVQVLNDA